ncbi:uncharacterized protein LOC123658286 [Melitaea cinxia]|uniref:uncharacterized protein LOC123658286 n=1 Tax=Melitaea cinxia TaxID=113334 RepID=UPI001E271F46|nr:uncharacterized protein LOC123658286 [Melitaea cinxia]
MRTGLPNTCGDLQNVQDPRKTAVIDMELCRLGVSLCALQETRLPGEGSIREKNYTFFWKGKDTEAVREHGVGFAVRNDLLSSIETPHGVSERVMVLRLNTKCGFITIISAYAPTLMATDEAKSQFYDQLESVIQKVKPRDRLYILGDLNARVGQNHSAWPECIGTHGIGKINENGQRLLEFSSRHSLCVTNTYFKGKPSSKVSWRHPRSGHWHQLDLILTRKSDLGETLHTRTFHSAECETDHSLVVACIAVVKKKIHSSRPFSRRRIALQNTRDDEMVQKYETSVRSETASWDASMSVDEEWSKVKRLLTTTACEVFGHQDTKSQDWFIDNIQQLQPLLDSKRKAALNYRKNPCPKSSDELRIAKANLQRSTRHFVNAYWNDLCMSIQSCADTGNFGGVYSGIRTALGPVIKKTAPLKEADGTIISDSLRQMSRWVEYYTGLYSQPVDVQREAVHNMPKLATWEELDDPPTVEELLKAVKQLKCGKSPGSDGTHAEIIRLKCILPVLHNLLWKCWEKGYIPQDMRDANIITLYKGKGDRGDCNCYRGISLLSIVGKLFGRVVLGRIQKLANRVYPESQCGFRAQRSAIDMVFTLRQLQEKSREQNIPLFVAFVDLNKAFDTVSRDGLYNGLESIGCPSKLLSLTKCFHKDMKGSVIFNGNTSGPFEMRRGVRQGCVLAPTLFGIFFSLLLREAFGNDQQGIHFYTRTDGKLYNITKLLKSKRNREDIFVDSLLFADDAAFVADSALELQTILDRFARACALFSMMINAKKTVVMVQGSTKIPKITLDGVPLAVVNKFAYLGSTVSNNLSLDAEIDIRIGKAATTFGQLNTRVWKNKHLTTRTKMIVYQACIMSILSYGAETWTTYAKQERRLNAFHMRCLRNILGISWEDRVTNERVLNIAQLPSFTALLKQKRLRWLGHVHRILLGAVANAKRNLGRPMLRFKDCAKRDMHAFGIDHQNWEAVAESRDGWRKVVVDGRKIHDQAWFETLAARRTRQQQASSVADTTRFTCRACGKGCRSRIGLFSHEKSCVINSS